jgi:hypothetical protein
MIDEIDRRLRAWTESVVEGSTFSLTPPDDARSGSGVSFYLLALAEKPPTRTTRRAPLQLALHYLVTTWADAPEEAHRLLGELVFAAMETDDFEVDLDPIPPEIWAAFAIAPRPAFVLRVPLRKERPEPEVKRVQTPLVVQVEPVASLYGRVLGPNDTPVMGASVEVPALQIVTRTDVRGRFSFRSVPGGNGGITLRVQAKGQERSVTVEDPTSEASPVVIRFDAFD